MKYKISLSKDRRNPLSSEKSETGILVLSKSRGGFDGTIYDNIQDAFGYSHTIKNHKGPISYQFPIKDLDKVSKNKDDDGRKFVDAKEFYEKIKDIESLK